MQGRLFTQVHPTVAYIPAGTGTLTNPAILQVTMGTEDANVQLLFSLTVKAARQLQEALARRLQSLDDPSE